MTGCTMLTSDRYIVVGEIRNGVFRVAQLHKGLIVPCRWNMRNRRLESVALNGPAGPVCMHSLTDKIREWCAKNDARPMTEEQAELELMKQAVRG